MRTFIVYTLLAAAALLQGCGTGIDSTRAVTASDVRRVVAPPTPEQLFLADIAPEPLRQWRSGKRLRVTDDRFKLTLGNTAPEAPLAGTDITFRAWEPRVTATGDTVTALNFNSDGGTIVYTAQASPSALDARGRVEIPFTIELSMVDEARRRMLGNDYYMLVADRFTLDGDNSRRRKFIPVRVVDVRPGSSLYPLAVVLEEEGDPSRLSMVYMNTGNDPSATRPFASLLAFDNPRRRYPGIADEVWARIVGGTVADGMTRDECRLALGAPESVDRYSTGSMIVERWTYDGGAFLVFEDGLLRRFRR